MNPKILFPILISSGCGAIDSLFPNPPFNCILMSHISSLPKPIELSQLLSFFLSELLCVSISEISRVSLGSRSRHSSTLPFQSPSLINIFPKYVTRVTHQQ